MPQTKKDLKDHHWILFNENVHPLSEIFNKPQIEKTKNSYLCIESCEGMRQTAEAGHGIAALMIDPQDLKGSTLVEVLPKLELQEIPVYLTYPNYLKSSQRITQFRDYLREVLREEGEYIYSTSTAQTPLSIYKMQEDSALAG